MLTHSSSSTVLMVRPANFGFNDETAPSNHFQISLADKEVKEIQKIALKEFDQFVKNLQSEGVTVVVINDTAEPRKPDSVFPNNWISTDTNGTVYLYPMEAPNRRLERSDEILKKLNSDFEVENTIDLSPSENKSRYLEGTGSMVFDHQNKVAYGAISTRTDEKLFKSYCKSIGYSSFPFLAKDQNGLAIYHTNVMMSVGSDIAVVCTESIAGKEKQQLVVEQLKKGGRTLIEINFNQMNHFAANVLQLQSKSEKQLLAMSSQAYEAYTPEQLHEIEKKVKIVHSPLTTIETLGGGSARCMIAEIFLTPK